jgi:hypothetical protein
MIRTQGQARMGTGQIGAGAAWGRKGAIILDLCRKAFQSWWTNRLVPPGGRGHARTRSLIRGAAGARRCCDEPGTGRWALYCDGVSPWQVVETCLVRFASRVLSGWRLGGASGVDRHGLGADACGWPCSSAFRRAGWSRVSRQGRRRQGGASRTSLLGRRLVRACRPGIGRRRRARR